eukprot:TRINITY_DN21696_c0_g1_i2.p1 TRINITY_DN21696_c0_g1~~TRINITY_DN21696_c0_g1_i2.p1  ORF type:complete len:213 (+),score=29.62 TRINITY_DN21696_c0_g1_i2:198-836(+)
MADDEATAADPSAAVAYGETKYWNSRYKQEGMQTFDWYQRYSALANLMDKYVSKKGKILVAGCGNSGMSAEMFEDGYKLIHNVDISPVVVEAMKEKYKDFPAMEWEVMDVKSMTFEDESFDTVVDKGTLDSLMCGDDSTVNARKMLSGVSRILRPNGTYVLITYGDPRLRMSHLQRPDYKWTVHLHVMRECCAARRAAKGMLTHSRALLVHD